MTFVTSEPYIGHLGLGGVGDSKTLMESEMRDKHIKWVCNAKVTKAEAGKLHAVELDDLGKEKRTHELPFRYAMILPAFPGVEAVAGIEGLTNPRGFVPDRRIPAQSEVPEHLQRRCAWRSRPSSRRRCRRACPRPVT